MIRVTTWSPDTCGCTLEYSWDDAEPEDARTHSLSRVVHSCPAHPNLPEQELYAAVVNENKHKNKVFAEAKKAKPDLKYEDYEWSFDGKRKLKVSFKNLDMADKQKVEKVVKDEFKDDVEVS
jgi:hypothetical protein